MGVQDSDQYVIAFEQASNHDVSLIGGKCAGPRLAYSGWRNGAAWFCSDNPGLP